MQNIVEVHSRLMDSLNDSILSVNSIYGLLILLFLLGLFVVFMKKIRNFVTYGIALLLLLQILHVVAYQTPFGEWLPVLRSLFKYEPLVAIAQLFVGTPICKGILWVHSFLYVMVDAAFSMLFYSIRTLFFYFNKNK